MSALQKPAAWLHTLDNTEGIPSNTPERCLSFSKKSPFGVPGVDHSKSYPVTKTALYEHPARVASAPESNHKLINHLQTCIEDPMWADHVEISKVALRQIIVALTKRKNHET